MACLIEMRNLVKRHYQRGAAAARRSVPAAVDGVSLAIDSGTIFGLVGESGCGKTTLARSLLFLDPPTSGEVYFDGVRLGGLRPSELRALRRRMQIVFQDPNGALDPRRRVRNSMEEGLRNFRVPAAERLRRVDELLDFVGIPASNAARFPHEFSGGQKQRIVVARALTVDPQFIVLDEPVSNLDVSIQAQIVNLLLDVKERFSLTYLFISHDLHLVAYMSDRVGVMYRGRLVEVSPTSEIMARPLHPYTVRLFSSVPGVGANDRDGVDDTPPLPLPAAFRGCPYYGACQRGEPRCRDAVPALTEVRPGHLVACLLAESGV